MKRLRAKAAQMRKERETACFAPQLDRRSREIAEQVEERRSEELAGSKAPAPKLNDRCSHPQKVVEEEKEDEEDASFYRDESIDEKKATLQVARNSREELVRRKVTHSVGAEALALR